MTLQEVFDKWKDIADRKSYDQMKEEIIAFVEEAKATGATYKDLTRCKDRILYLWSPRNWKEAQKEFPHWREPTWYNERHKWLIERIGFTLRTQFAEDIADAKTQVKYEKPAAAPAPEDTMPTFDNLEDFQAWKNRKAKMG